LISYIIYHLLDRPTYLEGLLFCCGTFFNQTRDLLAHQADPPSPAITTSLSQVEYGF